MDKNAAKLEGEGEVQKDQNEDKMDIWANEDIIKKRTLDII